MQSKIDDISKIIKEQIKNYSKRTEQDEVGYVISVGDGTELYPLNQCNGVQATASGIRTRTRYATKVTTTATGGAFRLLGKICCYPTDILTSIDGTAPAAAAAGDGGADGAVLTVVVRGHVGQGRALGDTEALKHADTEILKRGDQIGIQLSTAWITSSAAVPS